MGDEKLYRQVTEEKDTNHRIKIMTVLAIDIYFLCEWIVGLENEQSKIMKSLVTNSEIN